MLSRWILGALVAASPSFVGLSPVYGQLPSPQQPEKTAPAPPPPVVPTPSSTPAAPPVAPILDPGKPQALTLSAPAVAQAVRPQTLPITLQLLQQAPPQPVTQAFTLSVLPVDPAPPAAPITAPVTAQAAPGKATQFVSTPGSFRMFVGNIGELMALSKQTRVVTYYPTPAQQIVAAPVVTQAVTVSPQSTSVCKKLFCGLFTNQ